MQQFKLSEGTAARRRFYLHLVDATDGITPETGEAAGQPQISVNGAAFGNTSATLTAIGNGAYYVELTAGELGTLGAIMVRYKSAATAEFQDVAYMVAYDPYAAAGLGLTNLDAAVSSRSSHSAADVWAVGARTLTGFGTLVADIWAYATRTLTAFAFSVTVGTNNDKTGYGLSAAAVQAIWDALTSALTTVGSIGKRLADDVDATISSRSSHTAADVWSAGTRTLTSFGTLVADIWSNGTRTLTSLGASLVQEIWDRATSALTTAGSIGKLLVDNVNATVSSRSSHAAGDIWSVATRLLTAGTNIVLAKGVGVTGFNDLSAVQINAEVDAALDTAIPVAPTADSINERLKTIDDADLPGDTANIEADTQDVQSRLPAALVSGRIDASVGAMAASVVTAAAIATGAIQSSKFTSGAITADKIAADAIGSSELADSAAQEIADAVLDRAISNVEGTATARSLAWLIAMALNKSTMSGNTLTVYKADGTTAWFTITFAVDATADPTVGVSTAAS